MNFWGSVFLEIIFFIAYFGVWDGIHDIQHYRDVIRNGRKTKATIKDYKTTYYRTKNYHLILKYKDFQNNTHQICTSESTVFLTKKYRKGSKISIAYSANAPENPILIPEYFYYALMKLIIFGVFSIGSLICSIGMLI